MRLTATQARNVEQQLGVHAVPEEHPVFSDLTDAFGEHTFFLDAAGLNIVQTDPASESSSANVVKLASWASEKRKELLGQAPEVLDVTVELEAEDPDPAA